MFGPIFDSIFGSSMGTPYLGSGGYMEIKPIYPNFPTIVSVNKLYLDAMQKELAKKHPDYIRVAEYADMMIKERW